MAQFFYGVFFMAITIHDIAKLAGVSATTVSWVLNKKDKPISEQTKQKILDIAREHNYTPNRVAVSLATKKTNTLGVIIPDLSNLFFLAIMGGIEKKAREKGYSIFLCNSGESVEACAKYVGELEKRCVDGIFIIPPAGINEGENYMIMQKALNESKTPYILIERAVHDVFHDFVTSDNEVGGDIATKHLIGLGHKKIGCITGPLSEYGAIRRLSGYKAAMQECGLPVPESYIYTGDYHMESGIAGASQLISLGVTAIFACNDLMAVGVLQAAEKHGIPVPGQLSVVGYDNNPIAKLVSVPLTTIGQPADLMGRRACKILLEKIDRTSDLHTDYYFSPVLIERKSTSKIPS